MSNPTSTDARKQLWEQFVALVDSPSESVQAWPEGALEEELKAHNWTGKKRGEVVAHWRYLRQATIPSAPSTVLSAVEIKRLIAEELNDIEKKKQQLSAPGFSYTLPLSDLSNQQMKVVLQDATIQEVSNILTRKAPEALVAAKWLQLHSVDTPLSLKHDRDCTENDRSEIIYYPLLLKFFEAAAMGQSEVCFTKQNYSKPAPREDIVGFMNGVAECPCENKFLIYASKGGNGDGVRANIEGFAGLARCLSKVANDILDHERSATTEAKSSTIEDVREFLCTFTGRIQSVFIVKMEFDFVKHKIVSVTASPKFPVINNFSEAFLCTPDFGRNKYLHELLPPSPTPGFISLVNLVEELRFRKTLPVIPLQLKFDRGEPCEVQDDYEILHQGTKSIILHKKDSNVCIKIGLTKLIQHECMIHQALDAKQGSESHLRRALRNGSVIGAGNGLCFIELEGFGECFDVILKNLDAASIERLWNNACSGLKEIHNKGYFHGDIKPSNMLIINGSLIINDFDLSCPSNMIPLGKTAHFSSPRVQRTKFECYSFKDDYISLVLSFLSLNHSWSNAMDKDYLLRNLPAETPQYLKDCVNFNLL